MSKLDGKTAIVTGASHRVGREIALALAREGADVLVHHHPALHAEALETARLIENLGRKASCAAADMTVWREAQRVGHAALQTFGKVDILINSASSFVPHAFFDVTEHDVDLEFGVHIKGVTALSQVIGRHMIDRDMALGGGHIVNMVDLGAFIDANDFVMHNLAKGALEHLSHVMAIALAPRVRVNSVCPGPFLKAVGYTDEQWESLRDHNLLHDIGDPDQITATIMFLLTGPRFITGSCIRVDGGQLIMRERLH